MYVEIATKLWQPRDKEVETAWAVQEGSTIQLFVVRDLKSRRKKYEKKKDIYILQQMSTSEPVMKENQTLCTKFSLVAFSSLGELQPILFVLFLAIYTFTVVGNLVIMCLIWVSPTLHTPMYFFLANLSFLEMCYITSVVPQMLVHLLVEPKTISVACCAAQMYVFTILGLTECCLLAAMAYDRFVAICYPLRYTLLMSPRVCLHLAAASWTTGVVVESAQTTWIFTL
ncbi:olfactory receptor 2D3-like, partial [Petaurus breviceps papuanus]|uniref:olfactory receptor 2D3-like n=1 Tax=Petaurus breviceps papuanus TaxID=3040969 RepID=UPI0036DF2751